MSNEKTYKPEQDINSDIQDDFYNTTKALISISSMIIPIPGIGGAINNTLGIVWKSPIEKRRDKWIENIENALIILENKVESQLFKNLINDEEFISLFIQTTLIAIKSHQDEKLKILKNSLVNSYISNISFDIKASLINKLEKLSPSHLRILKFIESKSEFFYQTNDYKIVFEMFKQHHKQEKIKLEDFVFLVDQLKEEGLIVGEMKEINLEKTKRSISLVASPVENDYLPYLTINYLGRSILKLIEEI